MYSRFLLTILFFLSLWSGANSSPLRAALFLSQAELDESEIFALDPRFASVGAVLSSGGSASGVLIHPEWVLMSGHQVFRDPSVPNTNFEFRLGSDYQNPLLTRAVTEVHVHPGWRGGTSGSQWGDVDLALIRLANPITDVAPAVRFQATGPYSEAGEGTQFFMAGYGRPGIAGIEPWDSSIKRAGTNMFLAYQGGYGGGDEADINLQVDSGSWPDPPIWMEWKGTPGDSGGGWFREVNGEYQLVGISSWVTTPHWDPGSTYAVRTSLFNDWIDSTITTVPEPSCMVLLSVLPAFAFVRSGRDYRQLCYL